MSNGARGKRGGARDSSLSRDERSQYGETGFAPLQDWRRCPDCRDNELSPPSSYDEERAAGRQVGPQRTYGCETCSPFGRLGWIPATGKERLDPYMTPKAIHG